MTYGSASNGVSMADYIARLTKSNFKKDAVMAPLFLAMAQVLILEKNHILVD